MADLNDIAVFVKVAQFQSFTRAAHALGIPVSTVSRKVSALEEALGVTLIQRTTRKLSLTAQGQAYFSECREPLNLLADAERVLTQTQREPAGSLRVSVPVIFSQDPFLDFLSGFMKQFPRIRIDLFITNLFVDLLAENIDVGIRFGALQDSSLIARKLGVQLRHVVATPEYLKFREPPRIPEDLKLHQCVLMNGRNNEAEWELISGRRQVLVPVSGPISSRDYQSVSRFVYRGHGIGFLPTLYCDEPVRKGRLKRLLPEWTSRHFDVHAVYPTRNFLPARLTVFLEALRAWDSPLWTKP